MMPFEVLRMRSPATAAGWTTVLGPQTTANVSNGFQGYTARQLLPAAQLADVSGSKVRITIRGGGSNGLSVSKCYIGPKGTGTWDFSAVPTQVLFGGSAAGSVGTGGGAGADLVSDAVTFAYTGTSDIVISWFFAASPTTDVAMNALSGATNGFKLGDDAITTVASGYSTTLTSDNMVKLLESMV